MSFARPLWLLGAIALLVAAAMAYRAIERSRARHALLYSNLDFMLAATAPSKLPAALYFGAWLGGVALLALTLAGPHFWARVPLKDGVVMLCIDTSGSMRAHDLQPSRSAAAKAAARDFLDEVPPGTRLGLVTFASSAMVLQAPTSDLGVVRDALERMPLPNGATAIGDALSLANQMLPERGHRVIVLLTDGVNNRGSDPVAVAQGLAQHQVRIYTVGVGTTGSGELIPGTGELADLDEETLRAIAGGAGGAYVHAGDAGSLEGAFRELARETVWERRSVDGSFPLAAGGGLLLLATFLTGFAAGKFP